MLRPCFSLFSLFLSRDLKISVATSKHIFILKYVATLTLLVSTRLVHPLSTLCRDLVFLSRPKLLLQHFSISTNFSMLQKLVSRQILCLQFSIMSQHKLSCSQLTCICFSHSLSRPAVFCCDLAQLSTIRLWCCDIGNVVATQFL